MSTLMSEALPTLRLESPTNMSCIEISKSHIVESGEEEWGDQEVVYMWKRQTGSTD